MILDSLKQKALADSCSIVPHKLPSEHLAIFVRRESDGAKCIFYNELFPKEETIIAATKAFVHHLFYPDENEFCITRNTMLNKDEMAMVYEFVMPENYVYDFIERLLFPTTYALASLFEVTQEFVRERLVFMGYTGFVGGYNL